MSTSKWGGRKATNLREYVLRRDGGICWICGKPGATTIDHIKPKSTHPQLMWEPTNLKAAHGPATGTCPGQYARGNTPTPTRGKNTNAINVITGPPCAGKSTHVKQHAKPSHLVLDHDAIAKALGSPDTHTAHGPHAAAARLAKNTITDHVLNTPPKTTVWIITTNPTPTQLDAYKRANATITLIDPGISEALKRAAKERDQWTTAAIRAWYHNNTGDLIAEYQQKQRREW